jgi:hypothetical protein
VGPVHPLGSLLGLNSAIRRVKQAIFEQAEIVDEHSDFWNSVNTL